MKKLSKQAFEEIRLWVYRNARQVELSLWQYEFENGSKDALLSALSCYQNDDGGFGNALEPDCHNPNSSPYTTKYAIEILRNVNFDDASHPIMQGIIKFLESGKHLAEYGWLFNIPSNDEYPCAPWWAYDPKVNEVAHITVTAEMVCFLLRFVESGSMLYKQAFAFAEKLISEFENVGKKKAGLAGYYKGYYNLINTVRQMDLASKLDISYLVSNIKERADEVIERDVAKWGEFNLKPSSLIPSPDSPLYLGNEDIVEKELDYLLDTRPDKGTWGIAWQWWGHYEKYPKEFAVSENWWKSFIAVEKLKFLQKFDMLDFSL